MKKFGLQIAKPVCYPVKGLPLFQGKDKPELELVVPYSELIRSVMHRSITGRQDSRFEVGFLARFMNGYRKEHSRAANGMVS